MFDINSHEYLLVDWHRKQTELLLACIRQHASMLHLFCPSVRHTTSGCRAKGHLLLGTWTTCSYKLYRPSSPRNPIQVQKELLNRLKSNRFLMLHAEVNQVRHVSIRVSSATKSCEYLLPAYINGCTQL